MTAGPMSSSREADRRGDRLLARLAETEAIWVPGDPPTLRTVGPEGLKRMRAEPEVIGALLDAGLVERRADPDGGEIRLVATAAGRARVLAAATGLDPARAGHGHVARRRIDVDGPDVLVDLDESPLARLARRRDRDGRSLVSADRLAAGERLRRDFTLARMMPTVTSNWSIGRIGGGGRGGVEDLADRTLAARDRVRAALDAVDGDLADLLLDVCCFLRGLEEVEARRRWPARSAKVVLDIALGRLAGHYGLEERAIGPERARRIRGWGTPDHRPAIGGGTPPGGA
jgi:hypothetical protein